MSNLALLTYRFLMGAVYLCARFVAALTGAWSRIARKPIPLLHERLGFYPQAAQGALAEGQNLWLHAASAGEVNALGAFCAALRKARPSFRLILTTTSTTGRKLALEKGLADFVFLAPLDAPGSLGRAFRAFRPAAVLVAETELWPLFLLQASQNGIPLVLVNGRISNRSFPRYRAFRSLFAPCLQSFSECLVQTQGDKDKLEALGADGSRIKIAGQLKYDLSTPEKEAVRKFGEELGLQDGGILFTLGSLREGEDDQVLRMVPKLLALSPRAQVLAAPRHLKNVTVFRKKLEAERIRVRLRSVPGEEDEERVILLDTVGELPLAYALSQAAFVGGTLVPIGGHNIMEPALASVPVCFGPFVDNVKEAAQALLKEGGGFQIQKASELPPFFERFLDEKARKDAGAKAYRAVASMRGATEKTLERVLSYLPSSPQMDTDKHG